MKRMDNYSWLAAALMIWAMWVFGGYVRGWTQAPLLAGGVVLWCLNVRGWINQRPRGVELLQAVFCVGFLGVLCAQWVDWWGVVERYGTDYVITADRGLSPFCVVRREHFEMFAWFVPGLGLLMMRVDEAACRRINRALVWSGVLLAGFGLLSWWLSPGEMYFSVPVRKHYFASFLYENTAGSFFILMLGLIARGGRSSIGLSAVSHVLAIALCAVAVVLSGCRFMTGALILIGVLIVARRIGARPESRVWVLVAVLGLVWFGRDIIARGFELRINEWIGQLRMARAFPLWGAGGWGGKYLLGLFSADPLLPLKTAGTHNDYLVFLVEFGIIGSVCLWGGILCAGVGARWQFWPGVVMCLVMLHGFVDMPFRSPAVFYLWIWLLKNQEKGGMKIGICSDCSDCSD